MRRNLRRLILALVISTACFFGTDLWYRLTQPKRQGQGDKTPVARLSEVSNEVQRKEVKRVIWEQLSLNEDLFTGEAIRTTDQAEAKIRLIKSGATIHLEPDSLVVLEENASGLQLDFLQGNLFVQGSGEDLTLKTESGRIKLKGADLNLSKDKSGQVNLEVLKGQAELEQGNKKTQLSKDKGVTLSATGVSESQRLQVLSPQAGDVISLNLLKGEQMQVTWKPLPPGYTVHVESGPQRQSLTRLKEQSVPGESGRLNFPVKPGRWFLRLVAEGPSKLTSSTLPYRIDPKAPPALLEPTEQKQIVRTDAAQSIPFRWLPRNAYSAQVIEIAKDAQFKSVTNKQNLDGSANQFSLSLADGKWFWRVTGFLPNQGKTEALTSTASTFEIVSKIENKPPTLIAPQAQLKIPYQDTVKNGVSFRWKGPSGIDTFKLVLQRSSDGTWKSVYEQDVEGSGRKLASLKPGVYRWQMLSLSENGEASPPSSWSEFTINDLPRLEWAIKAPEVEHLFSTPTPTLRAQWQPHNVPAKSLAYRYRLSPEAQALEDQPWQSTKQNMFDVNLASEGRYRAIVEAVDESGATLAQSEPKLFTVKRQPLLPAPQWTATTPPILKADSKGNLSFAWVQVDGAKQYQYVLENDDGKVVEKRALTRTTASISKLKPGQYRVRLRAVDAQERLGHETEVKKVEVPNVSDIQAPKIKAMKVK